MQSAGSVFEDEGFLFQELTEDKGRKTNVKAIGMAAGRILLTKLVLEKPTHRLEQCPN
jgi:hypothetical protein